MKSYRNKKRELFIISYILTAVIYFIFDSINEIDGKYALYTKGFRAFVLLSIGIFFVVRIIKVFRMLRNKKLEIIDMLVIIIFIFISVYSLLQGGRNIPAISRDIIEGKYSTSLEISDKSKIVERKIGIGRRKYYISGITLNGTEITFEVSDTTYIEVIKINQAKNIKIEYWKHSKTISSWDDGSN